MAIGPRREKVLVYVQVTSKSDLEWRERVRSGGLTGQDALPQSVRLPHGGLPQAQRAVLGAAGVQLAVGTEAHAVHGPEVTLIRLCQGEKKENAVSAIV